MARRSSRGSVYNKRSNEQVQAARTSGGSQGGILPQAYAQSSNPTQNQSPQLYKDTPIIHRSATKPIRTYSTQKTTQQRMPP